MKILENFEIATIGDKFVVVDRATTPAYTLSVHDTIDEAERALDRARVLPDEWMQLPLFQELADALARHAGVSYATAVTVLETLGADQVWALADEFLDRLAAATHLADE